MLDHVVSGTVGREGGVVYGSSCERRGMAVWTLDHTYSGIEIEFLRSHSDIQKEKMSNKLSIVQYQLN